MRYSQRCPHFVLPRSFAPVLLCGWLALAGPGAARLGAGEGPPAAEPPAAPERTETEHGKGPIPGYCGIYCLHAALGILGKDVRFETLVSPRYVTSKSGSSAAALASAAEENGLEVKVLRKMTCDMLRAVTMPVLLHVRSSLLAADYDHWILYLGSTGDRVQIYDGSGNTTTISLASLAARWDGAGLLVSDRPISLMPFYASALLNMFLFANGIVASALLWRRLRAADPAALRCRDRASRRWSFVGEVALLLCFSLWACGSLFLFSPSGYLSDVESIHAIQDRHIADLSPSLTAAELERLLPSKDLLLIDARQARDFRAGSIPGAISIPADASATPERIRQVLSRYPRSTRIVLYCQSLGCHYDEYIGRLLYDAGYDRLSFFSGGWLEWQEMKRKST